MFATDHSTTGTASEGSGAVTVEGANSGLIAIDARGNLVLANEAARRMLGVERPEIGAPISAILATARVTARDWTGKWLPLIGGHGPDGFQIVAADGADVVVARNGSSDGTILISLSPVVADDWHTSQDALTGLTDQRGFHHRFSQLCAPEGHRTAIVLVGLDRFKNVNDALGHVAGDALLTLVAKRLRGTFRNADVVGRLGGDKFAAALPTGPTLDVLAARLISVLSRPYLVDRQTAVIGASVGLAMAPHHGTEPKVLMRAAELALDQSKAEGKGIVRVFSEELGERTRTKHALAEDLRRAIPMQQLEVFFQPQLSLKTDKLTGFEALVRWRHPERGLVSPDAFIPLAEESGLICALGEWVMFEACRQAAAWPASLRVAVNVSARQLQERDRLPRVVAAALSASGLEAHRLEVEVTESALIDEDVALGVLTELRQAGVQISMDDFGTGYSSLSQLRRFPFDKLKIDRSFIHDLSTGSSAKAVVRAITALGVSLGLSITAEGVENADQKAVCRADGCTEMQGFLISQPVPGHEVAAIIDRYL